MSSKLLAAHLAAIMACALAGATSMDDLRAAHNSTPACDQIAAADTLERPAGVVCISPRGEYRGISATIDEASLFEFVQPAPAAAPNDEIRRLDVCFLMGCGLVCISLGGLRINVGRKRHRVGARKSVLRLRMMA